MRLMCLVVIAGCASGPTEYDAKQAFIANENANWWGLLRAAHEVPAVEATRYATQCPVAGAITVTGDFADGATPSGAFAVQTQLDECNLGNPGSSDPSWHQIVDGRVQWVSDGPTQTMDGFIHYRGHSGAFDCTIALRMTVGETTRYAGTVCDFDVQLDLGITP